MQAKAARPERIAGASRNGMSNAFPRKYRPTAAGSSSSSAANGLLMRPDSRLYIVPSSGEPRASCERTRR